MEKPWKVVIGWLIRRGVQELGDEEVKQGVKLNLLRIWENGPLLRATKRLRPEFTPGDPRRAM